MTDKQNEFLYRMSRHLRLGLADLQKYVSDLYRIEELEDYIGIKDSPIEYIQSALTPLIAQVNDFQDYAEAVTGRMELDLQEVDIYAIIEAALVLSLAFVIFRFVRTTSITVVATPVPINPNIPAGRLRFDDFSGVTPMDQITLSLNNVEFPEDGTHYESWLVPDDGGSPRKIGEVIHNDAGVGQVILIDPDQQNLLQNSSQVIITQETEGVAANQPSGKVVYSSVFPPESLIPIRKLLVSYANVPDELALIQGLWYYSGYYVTISINGDKDTKTVGLLAAYNNGDEATVRARIEEIINQIVGNQSDQFLDYNNDDNIDNTPGDDIPTDGFGTFPNGTQNG